MPLCFGDVRVGAGQQDRPVAVLGPRGPHLLPVHHEHVPVPDGPGGQSGQVRAGVGLGEELAPHLLAPEHGSQVAVLLLLGAVGDQGRPAHADPHREHADRHVEAGDLLVEDGLAPGRVAPSAVLDGPGDRPPATLVERVLPGAASTHVVRVLVIQRPVVESAPRLGVVRQPRPHLGAEPGVVGTVVEVHRSGSVLGRSGGRSWEARAGATDRDPRRSSCHRGSRAAASSTGDTACAVRHHPVATASDVPRSTP